jgi:PAS domain S-box-containing protein
MRRLLHPLPLRRKLRLGLVATCLTALVLACAALFWFQFASLRRDFAAELESLGAILARNSATPLVFDDRQAGKEVLAALRVKPQIVSARIYDARGRLFAELGGAADGRARTTPGAPVVFDGSDAWLSLPIEVEGSPPGRLELNAQFAAEFARLRSLYALVSALVILGALAIVMFLSSLLERVIIRPITMLAAIAGRIGRENDYAVRAPEAGNDEVGLLTRAVNSMLDQIQARDARLRESQQRYEVAVMGSSDGLWDCALATGAVYFSPRWKSMLGCADHEIANAAASFTDLLHPLDRGPVQARIDACLAGRDAAYEATFRLRHKDGSYRWILSRGAALRDAAGRAVRFAGSHTDVTARVLAEEEERGRAERTAHRQDVLLKLARLAPLEWEGQLETMLAETAHFLGVARTSYWVMQPRQQVLAREKLFLREPPAFATDPARLPAGELPRHFAAMARTAQPVACDALLRDPRRAEPGPVSALHAPVLRHDRLVGVLVCEQPGGAREWSALELEFARAVAQQLALALEGHERRRAEEHLRLSELRYRTVVESVKEVIFQTDSRGRWSFLNSAWREITGYFAEDSLGRSCLELVHPEDRPRAARELRELLSGRVRSNRGEFRFLTQAGEVRWIEVATQTIVDRSSPLAGASGTMNDITERKAAEAELQRLNRELVATSRQAGMAEIATGVLHNVGNVLNSVNVSANLIADQVRRSRTASLARAVGLLREHRGDLGAYLATDPKGRQVAPFLEALAEELAREQTAIAGELQGLQANLDHIKQIVAMQQSYAKVAGVLEPIAPAELIEDALRMLAAALARQQIVVEREFAAVPAVLVDRHKVLQILVNLIKNARQALEGRAEGRRLVLRLALAGGRVRLEVADNGIGIPAENLTCIFSHGFTTKRTGHGFGLHSCANAARELGGALAARSDGPGLGATFTLELPVPMDPDRAIAA